MSKAKIASTARNATVQHKNDYPGYIRFGYRLPNGLVVTRQNAQIGIGTKEDGSVELLPCSFIDMVPVVINDAINFDHLTEVILFAVAERAKMDFDRNEQLAHQYDEVVAISNAEATDQAAYDSKWDALTHEADKLPNQLPDEDCSCDQCEGKVTGFEPRDEDDFSQPCGNCDSNECSGCKDSDQAEGPCIPLIGSDGEFIYPPDPGDENDTKGGHKDDCQCYDCEHPDEV